MKRVKCRACNVDTIALRSTRQTCSAACRQAFKRYCDRITREATASHDQERDQERDQGRGKLVECRDCGIRQASGQGACATCGGAFLNALIPDMV